MEFKVGRSRDGESCFFNAFSRGLEQKLGESLSAEQLRQQCSSFAENNPGRLHSILAAHNNAANTDDLVSSEDRWAEPLIEGRILCHVHAVTLHVTEKRVVEGRDEFIYDIVENAKNYHTDQNNRAIHIINTGDSHYKAVLQDRRWKEHGYDNSKTAVVSSEDSEPHSLQFAPERIPEFDEERQLWRVNVPRNGNCLFLSLTLAYLIPAKDDETELRKRLKILSGKELEENQCESMIKVVRDFNPFLNMTETYDNASLMQFIQIFRNRIVDHLSSNKQYFQRFVKEDMENYLFKIKNSKTWCGNAEIRAITELLNNCNIDLEATHSGQTGRSQIGFDGKTIIQLVYDVESSRVGLGNAIEHKFYYNFYVLKDIGNKFEVYNRFDQFIRSFVYQFITTLCKYTNQVRAGGKTINDEKSKKIMGTSIMGGLLLQVAGFGFSFGKESIKASAHLIDNKIERNLAIKITDFFRPIMNDQAKFTEMLIKVSAEIFRNFEYQFRRFTAEGGVQRAMDKLATDAIDRIVSYIANNNFDATMENCFNIIAKGVILGSSQRNIKLKTGHTLIDQNGSEHQTSDIYKKTGVLIYTNKGVPKFYDYDSDSQNGYRFLFEWEMDKGEKWLEEHFKSNLNLQQYEDTIMSEVEFNQKLNKILDEFKSSALTPENSARMFKNQASRAKQGESNKILIDISKTQKEHFQFSIDARATTEAQIRKVQVGLNEVFKLLNENSLPINEKQSIHIQESINNLTTTLTNVKLTNEKHAEIFKGYINVIVETVKQMHAERMFKNNTESSPSDDINYFQKVEELASQLRDEIRRSLPIKGPSDTAEAEQSEQYVDSLAASHNRREHSISSLSSPDSSEKTGIGLSTDQGETPDNYFIVGADDMPPKETIDEIEVANREHLSLHYSSAKGKVENVKKILKAHTGDALNVKMQISQLSQCTPLYLAAQNGYNKIVKILLSRNRNDIHVDNGNGDTPLHAAVYFKKLDVVLTLLEHKADVNLKNNRGLTPLFYAIQNNSEKIVKALLSKSYLVIDKGESPLILAAASGFHRIVDILLKDERIFVNDVTNDKFGMTALYAATAFNHLDIVKTLLESGAHVNLKSNSGHAPLHKAILNQRKDIVDVFLLNKYVDINISNNSGMTALHYSASISSVELVNKLLKRSAVFDSKTVHGHTPLNYATDKKIKDILRATGELFGDLSEESISEYLKEGAAINARNSFGVTPFHHAVQTESLEIVELLLKHGANPNIPDFNNAMPLCFGISNRDSDNFYFLVKEDAYCTVGQCKDCRVDSLHSYNMPNSRSVSPTPSK